MVPGLPHHLAQRGNYREPVVFNGGNYAADLDLTSKVAKASGTEIWAYCLLPNPVHVIMTPSHGDGLRVTFAEAHRRDRRDQGVRGAGRTGSGRSRKLEVTWCGTYLIQRCRKYASWTR
ncbi:MAG: hypothetical protein CGW95_00060 [Phenylobacterium zucineum]|nr:MAG: hypothetical protein CGW95_00060 [Phenylobacterium zucineum]